MIKKKICLIIISILFYLLLSVNFSLSFAAETKKDKDNVNWNKLFGKLLKKEKEVDEVCRDINNKGMRYLDRINLGGENTFYITITKEKSTKYRTSREIRIFRVNRDNNFKQVYKENIRGLQFTGQYVMPYSNKFMLTWFPPLGRRMVYVIYYDTGKEVKHVFVGKYDFIEFAYYDLYKEGKKEYNPYLFCSEIRFDKPGYIRTDVFSWDKKKEKYVLIKKLSLSKKKNWKDRFNMIKAGGKNPRFEPWNPTSVYGDEFLVK